ncbi:hypothetical protein ACQB6R_02485 [Propionibacteriaceae bacterium G1746]|uniref:hypothetical protein n=1 Tax=Aestuariimicrobium sp. G57 TaxID=3418485 RepID=UPI003C197268
MTNPAFPAADDPLTADDLSLVAAIGNAQQTFDPMPTGMVDRVLFALSLELMEAELAIMADEQLATARSSHAPQVQADTITFTSSSTSLMVVLTDDSDDDETVRIDGWVTGGGIKVTAQAGAHMLEQVSDATGRLVWLNVRHGPVRFLIESDRPGSRPVVTPTVEV